MRPLCRTAKLECKFSNMDILLSWTASLAYPTLARLRELAEMRLVSETWFHCYGFHVV